MNDNTVNEYGNIFDAFETLNSPEIEVTTSGDSDIEQNDNIIPNQNEHDQQISSDPFEQIDAKTNENEVNEHEQDKILNSSEIEVTTSGVSDIEQNDNIIPNQNEHDQQISSDPFEQFDAKTNKTQKENNNNPIKNSENDLSSQEKDTELVKPFITQKISAEKAIKGNKPPVLNRVLISSVILGVVSFFLIFGLVIYPIITQKKEKEDKSKPVASENSITDYASLIDKKKPTKTEIINNQIPDNNSFVELDEDGLPPVSEKFKPKENIQSNVVSMGGTGREVPDTSRDALQTKTISGIKGISNTQKNYLSSTNSASPESQGNVSNITTNPYANFGLPDKATYAEQMLAAANAGNAGNSYLNQNDQSGKNQFYSTNRGSVSGSWLPLNTIWQGSIFEAILTSNINTDLPGECTAIITKNVYSSQDGSFLLIPQNSKLYGSYNSSISYSQGRIQVGWHTLIRPDGYMQNLGNMSATDAQGASGLKGFINDHPFQYLKALGLMSAFNIISKEISNSGEISSNQYVQNISANSQNIANTLGSKLIDRAMDVQPTITIKSGTKINIVTNTTLTLPPLEPYPVTEPYHK